MIQINVRFFDFYVFRGNGANRSDAINFFNEEKNRKQFTNENFLKSINRTCKIKYNRLLGE